MTRTLKAGIALAVGITALGLGAAPALAATVGVSGTQLVIDGGPEDEVITVINPAAQTFVVADAGATLTPSSSECLADTPAAGQVTCVAAIAGLTIRGNDGADRITNDTNNGSAIDGGNGDDVIVGGGGDDFIFGGSGLDTVDGRGGNDRFAMQGTLIDTITCGDGIDTATVDDGDVVAADCENVIGRTGGPTTNPGTTTPPGTPEPAPGTPAPTPATPGAPAPTPDTPPGSAPSGEP